MPALNCLEACQFEALYTGDGDEVDTLHCVGCGVCVPLCPEGALEPGTPLRAEKPCRRRWTRPSGCSDRAAARGALKYVQGPRKLW